METDKVRENRLRRMVRRRGCSLHKSRRRDPDAWDFGTYSIVLTEADGSQRRFEALSIEEVEGWLAKGKRRVATGEFRIG